jgi:hypothetical protein
VLKTARLSALELLHSKNIKILDYVEVRKAYTDTTSYCLGYAAEDRIEIYVNAARLLVSCVSNVLEDLDAFLVHEYGHAFLFKVWKSLSKFERTQFKQLFGDYHSDGEAYENLMGDSLRSVLGLTPRTYNKKDFVSLYASTSPHEDWAETFAYYVYDDIPRKASIRLKTKVAYLRYLIVKYGRSKKLLLYRT